MSILNQFLDFKNGKTSPDRTEEGAHAVFGSNGEIGRSDSTNATGPLVVIGRVGSYCGSLYYSEADAWVTDNAIVCSSKDSKDIRYWYYAMQTLDLNGRSSGSGQPLLNQSVLGAIAFDPPGMDERQAIAEVLGALDDKIAANTRLVRGADNLAASLTRQALDRSAPVSLSSIADIVMGSSPSGASFNENGEGTVFYQGVRDFGVRFPSNRVWTAAPVRLAAAGDTLLSVRAPVGRVNLASEKTCIGRGLASIRSLGHRPFTLFHVLKDSHDIWAPFEAEGTVFGSINKNQLASIRVPSIRPEVEEQLEDTLGSVERIVASTLSENDHLATTRDALLPQLMSGKMRVRDAEKVLEDAGV
ncbi:restriction endonuclease subunit S [Paenarthrobacter sp. TAF1]|uniref:restriction endonuclease subunit S n=1 Tax=Paenarthrobacter sp. TAF1 TaxID=3233067 RepID=UPI003F972795